MNDDNETILSLGPGLHDGRGEPAAGYLGKKSRFGFGSEPPDAVAPFLLAGGDFLLPGESGGWLRMSAAGETMGKAFPDRQPGETITPQFERAGKLTVIRYLADGTRRLERTNSSDGTMDPSFHPAADLPADVNHAVPGTGDTTWLLSGNEVSWFHTWTSDGSPAAEQRIVQIDGVGSRIGRQLVSNLPRTLGLYAGLAGQFRLVYGPDRSRWAYWPSPTSQTFRIEWYSTTGVVQRRKDFHLGVFETFCWAEGEDGSLVATDTSKAVLRRFGPDGAIDPTFQSPGRVRSVKALAGGKWLIDGLRRLAADGREDGSCGRSPSSTFRRAWRC